MSNDFSIKCPQMEKVMAGLNKFATETSQDGALQTIMRGMFIWGEITRTKAIIPRTPKHYGNLRDTITVHIGRVGRQAALSFYAGGPSAPYAMAVHEHLSEHSPRSWRSAKINWTTPGTGPKYIENPVRENIRSLASEIETELEESMRRVFK